jgi:hypothetical protein
VQENGCRSLLNVYQENSDKINDLKTSKYSSPQELQSASKINDERIKSGKSDLPDVFLVLRLWHKERLDLDIVALLHALA